MKLSAHYRGDLPAVSFELFPPKTDEGRTTLMEHVAALCEFQPSYFTCTYGAGGSTRDLTLDIVAQVKQQCSTPVASHLTCVGSTREMLCGYLAEARLRGVDYIVALRGDPPQGQTEFVATAGGLAHANELVGLIHAEFPEFGVAVAGYPEVHREAISADEDLRYLKQKVDAGAEIVITQLFYQNDDFFRFRDRCLRVGIEVPLIPGILPVTSLSQIQRITQLCNAQLPAEFVRQLSQHEDPEWQLQIGVDQATRQVEQLLAQSVPGVHFYVLNKSRATSLVLSSLQSSFSRSDQL